MFLACFSNPTYGGSLNRSHWILSHHKQVLLDLLLSLLKTKLSLAVVKFLCFAVSLFISFIQRCIFVNKLQVDCNHVKSSVLVPPTSRRMRMSGGRPRSSIQVPQIDNASRLVPSLKGEGTTYKHGLCLSWMIIH